MTKANEITPRDLFAAAALAGLLAQPTDRDPEYDSGPPVWDRAFQFADNMMERRKRKQSPTNHLLEEDE